MACTATLTGHGAKVLSVVLHPTQASVLASASGDETVMLWNMTTGECTMTLTGNGGWVHSVVFHSTLAAVLASDGDYPALVRAPGGQWEPIYKDQQRRLNEGDQISLDSNDPEGAVFVCNSASGGGGGELP